VKAILVVVSDVVAEVKDGTTKAVAWTGNVWVVMSGEDTLKE